MLRAFVVNLLLASVCFAGHLEHYHSETSVSADVESFIVDGTTTVASKTDSGSDADQNSYSEVSLNALCIYGNNFADVDALNVKANATPAAQWAYAYEFKRVDHVSNATAITSGDTTETHASAEHRFRMKGGANKCKCTVSLNLPDVPLSGDVTHNLFVWVSAPGIYFQAHWLESSQVWSIYGYYLDEDDNLQTVSETKPGSWLSYQYKDLYTTTIANEAIFGLHADISDGAWVSGSEVRNQDIDTYWSTSGFIEVNAVVAP